MIAIVHYELLGPGTAAIRTFNLISGRHIYSHHAPEGCIIHSVWTHGKHLRFVVAKPGHITVWEAEFTSIHAIAEVDTLPLPNEISRGEVLRFCPTTYRLVFRLPEGVLVWDARDSKLLLNLKGTDHFAVDISPDGRFFACATRHRGIRVWSESPAGYVLCQELLSSDFYSHGQLVFPPNGESIIAYNLSTIHLWHTASLIPNIPKKSGTRNGFILGFSPDQTLAMVTRKHGNTITILDLKSGEPQLTIDTGMDIIGMGTSGSTVVAVGEGKVVAWDLSTGDCPTNARVGANDSIWTTLFDPPKSSFFFLTCTSISSDLSRIAIVTGTTITLYDVSTGKHLVHANLRGAVLPGTPWFTPDARGVWIGDCGSPHCGWTIVDGNGSGAIGLDPIGPEASPSGGFPWESSRGHEISSDGWVLGPEKERILWLPHDWRPGRDRRWGGRFLGLLHGTLPEAVILELYE